MIKLNQIEKLELAKEINDTLFWEDENQYFFNGLFLDEELSDFYVTSDKGYLLTIDKNNEIGTLKLKDSKTGFEVVKYIENLIKESNAPILFRVQSNNLKLHKFAKKLMKMFPQSRTKQYPNSVLYILSFDKMVHNVLSIDIDILFNEMPIYEKYIDEDVSPSLSWDIVKSRCKTNNEEVNFRPCAKTMRFILDILNNKCNNSSIFQIEEHNEIIDILRSQNARFCNIINLDNHEDVLYNIRRTELGIDNWVTHSVIENLCGFYWWIGREVSVKTNNLITNRFSNYENVKIDSLPEFDVVVFCKSKHYTPKEWWHLQENLFKYIHNKKECD